MSPPTRPSTKKARHRERRAADRAGLPVDAYRARIEQLRSGRRRSITWREGQRGREDGR